MAPACPGRTQTSSPGKSYWLPMQPSRSLDQMRLRALTPGAGT
jgi:hypothetical protein